MTTSGPEADAARLAGALSAILFPAFDDLERVAAVVAASAVRAREERAGPGAWTEADLGEVRPLVVDLLDGDDLPVGIGFVAAPGVLGEDRSMLWWQRNDGRTSRLKLNFDRSSIDVYDYVEMDWFRIAQEGRGRVVMGPYVDYSGSELYIVTISVPVLVEGDFVGIVGADLLFAELERRLVDVLRTTAFEAAVVNDERRVVAANSPRWVLGTRLAAEPAGGGEFAAVVDLPLDAGWVIAVAASEHGKNFELDS